MGAWIETPRDMVESLLSFISQFYDLHGGVEDSVELTDEVATDLAGTASMAGAETFGGL